MLQRLSTKTKSLGWLVFLGLLVAPASAHTVKVSGDVAALFHINPNHNPIAGQRSLAWFALTRRGGQQIPFEQCNCQLAVYPEPHKEGSKPLMQATLKPVSADQHQDVPGAYITFPSAGIYELELSGTPKSGASFKPFSLSYEVTVQPGGSSPTNSSGMEGMDMKH